jgi:hypothetical protein
VCVCVCVYHYFRVTCFRDEHGKVGEQRETVEMKAAFERMFSLFNSVGNKRARKCTGH